MQVVVFIKVGDQLTGDDHLQFFVQRFVQQVVEGIGEHPHRAEADEARHDQGRHRVDVNRPAVVMQQQTQAQRRKNEHIAHRPRGEQLLLRLDDGRRRLPGQLARLQGHARVDDAKHHLRRTTDVHPHARDVRRTHDVQHRVDHDHAHPQHHQHTHEHAGQAFELANAIVKRLVAPVNDAAQRQPGQQHGNAFEAGFQEIGQQHRRTGKQQGPEGDGRVQHAGIQRMLGGAFLAGVVAICADLHRCSCVSDWRDCQLQRPWRLTRTSEARQPPALEAQAGHHGNEDTAPLIFRCKTV